MSRLLFLPTVNQWRKDVLGLGKTSLLGASRAAKDRTPGQLCAVSPTVVPGYPADDSENIQTTGYWFLDEGQDWQLDPALSAFLRSGDPPVYIGFGSMVDKEADELTAPVQPHQVAGAAVLIDEELHSRWIVSGEDEVTMVG